MADKVQQDKKVDSKGADLPNKEVTPEKAGQVKGGARRNTLDDLELEY